jgi:hypothetical protein
LACFAVYATGFRTVTKVTKRRGGFGRDPLRRRRDTGSVGPSAMDIRRGGKERTLEVAQPDATKNDDPE